MERVCIENLDHLGRGIAKRNQKIVFIPNTIPGEIVEIELVKEKKKYDEAKVTSFYKESEERVKNLCPYFPRCGGCQLLHLPYSKQLQYKQEKMKNILDRYHLDSVKLNKIVASPNRFHYRNKVTFQNQNHQLGYFEGESNHFIPIQNCLLLDEKINQSIPTLPTNQGKLIVRSNQKEITFHPNKKIMHTIGDFQFAVSLESFFQVNDSVTPLLYQKVKEYLSPSKEDILLDLYCGTGTIGIFVSREAKKVIGIEKNKQAIEDAIENARINHIPNIEFLCGDAGIEANKLKEKITGIIIDPPRSGLNHQTLQTILQIHPSKIVYVACDPMTLIRDLNILKEDYRVEEITPFDMFPNTYHVENVVLLKKI